MLRYTVRPISDRTDLTTPPGARKRSPFDSHWTTTLDDLERELRMLNARGVILECDVLEREIRNDGMLRADARPSTPVVRLAFTTPKHGDLVYPGDRFNRWKDNVRAIALGLEALRKLERYGIAGRSQQYLGFKALPAGRAPADLMSTDEAYDIIVSAPKLGGNADIRTPALAWRSARIAAHPDKHDGDAELWNKLGEAGRVLGFTK